MIRKLIAEAFGTFCLVFAGTGAIIVDGVSGGAITHVGVAMVFGLIVLAMIYAVGEISGAHLNPAVTLGFYAAGRFPSAQVVPYIGSQLTGATMASGVLRLLFPTHATLGATSPSGTALQSMVLEAVLTLMLMFVILSVSRGGGERGITAGIVVGAVVMLEAMFAGPICGASMNPARSFGPAVVSAHLSSLWVYFAGPIGGAIAAVALCRSMHCGECCDSRATQSACDG